MAKSDHDRLIRIEGKIDVLGKQFSNHLKHHWQVTLTFGAVALAAILALIFK